MINRLGSILQILIVFCFAILLAGTICGQTSDDHDVIFTIPEIAILDIEPNNASITLDVSPPTEAGDPAIIDAKGTNSSKWLNYTSALSTGATNRSVSVQITNGTIPAGLQMKVQAAAYSGSGAGTHGNASGQITLSTTAQTIISGIGRCYTGDGDSNGHRLTYTLGIADYTNLSSTTGATIEVTYTISE